MATFSPVGWGAAAIAVGALLGLLPLAWGSLLLAGGIGAAALLAEPALAVIAMLTLAPLKALIETEMSPRVPLDVGQIMLMGTALAWGVWYVGRSPRRSSLYTWTLVPLLTILAAFSPSLWNAASVSAALAEGAKWGAIVVLIIIVRDLAISGRAEWIAFGVVWAAVLQAVLGIYQFYGGAGAPHLWIEGFRHFRAFGTFGQPNPFSAFMGLVLPLALGLAWGYAGRAWRTGRTTAWSMARQSTALTFWYGGCALLLLAGLIASWGRGAWLGFGVALITMVFFAPQRRWHGMMLLSALAVLVLIAWGSGALPVAVQARLDSAFDDVAGWRDVRGAPVNDANYATLERLAHWQAAMAMASAHLWTGVGLGNYEVTYADYALPRWPNALGHAHNDYLNTLAETGLVGVTGYMLGWGMIVIGTVRALRQTDPLRRGILVGLLGAWAHFLSHSLVDKLTVNNLFLHVGVMLGLLAWASEGFSDT
ncbi:MAG: O-antigen ligase family protein [Anaerolineae bacterium]